MAGGARGCRRRCARVWPDLRSGWWRLQLPEVLGVGKETLRFATIEGAFTIDELALSWSRRSWR